MLLLVSVSGVTPLAQSVERWTHNPATRVRNDPLLQWHPTCIRVVLSELLSELSDRILSSLVAQMEVTGLVTQGQS